MHYILTYTGAPDYLERHPLYREEHLRLTWAAVKNGDLILGGATGEPVDGAMLLFTGESAKAAEDFAAADPYVLNGLVTKWTVMPWHTVVGYAAANPLGSEGAPQFAIPIPLTMDVHENTYGIVYLGGAKLHFFLSDDKHLAEWSACRVNVGDINTLYALCQERGVVHPNGALEKKPWGSMEFAIIDPSGVCYTFAQRD